MLLPVGEFEASYFLSLKRANSVAGLLASARISLRRSFCGRRTSTQSYFFACVRNNNYEHAFSFRRRLARYALLECPGRHRHHFSLDCA